jgi:hypothetical protein
MPLTSNLCLPMHASDLCPIDSCLLPFLHGLSVSFLCSLSCQQPSTLHVGSQVPQLHPSSALPLPSLFRSLNYISHACLDLGLGYTPVMWYAACAWIVALGMRLVGGDCLCMGSRIGRRKLRINVRLFCSIVREGMCMASPHHTLFA